MTAQAVWQLASAGMLLAVLAAGFAWFERSRPPARVASAVAVLVAFAVVGRIVFAPFPNVKPTTDIVIIAGFVMGAEPGLIVGALTALVSNFFFGQGPWTPWQMAAWALCGLLGAALAAAAGGRMGRLPLALCCGAAGLIYGVVLNFGSAVNLGGSDVIASFWVYSVQSAPFDAAHAIGNFVFFMLAGPALVRALRRLRRRADVVWPAVDEQPVASGTTATAAQPVA